MNYTIFGSGGAQYLRALCNLGGVAWSSLIDKSGDWAISTQDDTDLERLLADLLAAEVEVEVHACGEMTFATSNIAEGHGAYPSLVARVTACGAEVAGTQTVAVHEPTPWHIERAKDAVAKQAAPPQPPVDGEADRAPHGE